MSLFRNPEEHAANPPETWEAVKVGDRAWHLRTKDGVTLAYCKTKREAEALKVEGSEVRLYELERRWYAGERIPGWRTYAAVVAERLEHLRSRLRSESISYGELAELQGLAKYIEDGDVELLEAAGVPEYPDLTLRDEGTVWLLFPNTDEASEWIEEHVEYEPWQSWVGGIACEPRMAVDVCAGAEADGLTVAYLT
jgi:hypothetical protein